MSTKDSIRFTLGWEELNLVEDALSYYLISTQVGGPEDHSPSDIKRVLDRVSRHVTRIGQAQLALVSEMKP